MLGGCSTTGFAIFQCLSVRARRTGVSPIAVLISFTFQISDSIPTMDAFRPGTDRLERLFKYDSIQIHLETS